jgi:hypothetical protein
VAELTDDPTVSPSPAPSGGGGGGDLSRDIERAVDRQPLDRVRCVRVFADHYRCNWWSPTPSVADQDRRDPTAAWAFAALHRVRQSRFLRATNTGGRLVIEGLDHADPS